MTRHSENLGASDPSAMTFAQNYRAFGLNMRAQIALSALPRASTAPHDVTLTCGAITQQLDPNRSTGPARNWQAVDQGFLLHVEGVAKYLVSQGKDIRIDVAEQATHSDVEAYLLGSAFAALLQQRELLTLHASAIDTPKGAVLFMGPSGAGKSTLLSAMLARGYSMLSDDISAVDLRGGSPPLVLPAFPTLRVTKATLAALGQKSTNLKAMRADKEKFLMPVNAFCAEARPLHRIFLLTPDTSSAVRFDDLEPREQFAKLTQFTFRRNYYRAHALDAVCFAATSQLAQRKLLRKITRPVQSFDLYALADAVEQAL